MRRVFLLTSAILLTGAAYAAPSGDSDYTKGIIFVNEDWYGHQNSTINFLSPDAPDEIYWQYRVFQTENPGYELGCTNQYGALWGDRLFLIAKQDKDPGASVAGGRITVADAKTMKLLHQAKEIDPSGAQCDGRGFVGITAHKGYVSSSNGIWILDLDTYQIKGQVQGSANPNAGNGSDKPNTDPTSSLYYGQTGTMLVADGKVFAAHQQYGLLVIDPVDDKVTATLGLDCVADGAGIGSIVKSRDGMLWLSVAKNTKGTGATLPYLVRVNPANLEYRLIEIPEGILAPSNSWYAWTPDAFVASQIQNCLYWRGGAGRNFAGTKIYKYDIDSERFSLHIDLDAEGANWKLYGCSMGIDPLNDELYMSLYHSNSSTSYITRRYSPEGEVIRDYEMIQNYWFPSLPVFMYTPQAGVEEIAATVEADPQSALYNISGVQVFAGERSQLMQLRSSLPHGIYILKSKGKTIKIIL